MTLERRQYTPLPRRTRNDVNDATKAVYRSELIRSLSRTIPPDAILREGPRVAHENEPASSTLRTPG